MNNKAAAIGALLCAASIASGAFGAHLIANHVSGERLATWHTASHYLGTQGLGILLLSLASPARLLRAIKLILAGVILFSSALFLIVLTDIRWFGAVAPIGGLLMISGWLSAGYTFFRTEPFEKP
jgi:uncharacterized membrane protein YgdD (TMEM256/DUF423 family)